jgi:hypothetical protein
LGVILDPDAILISGLIIKWLKKFLRPVLNILHPKRVEKLPDSWLLIRFVSENRPFDAILIFGCHFGLTDFLNLSLAFPEN